MNSSICCSVAKSLRLFVILWTVVHQAPLSRIISWNLLKFMSIELVMISNYLILCCPLLEGRLTKILIWRFLDFMTVIARSWWWELYLVAGVTRKGFEERGKMDPSSSSDGIMSKGVGLKTSEMQFSSSMVRLKNISRGKGWCWMQPHPVILGWV